MSEKVELQVNQLFNANIESKESKESKSIDIFKPEPEEYDVLNDNWPNRNRKLKRRSTIIKIFFVYVVVSVLIELKTLNVILIDQYQGVYVLKYQLLFIGDWLKKTHTNK